MSMPLLQTACSDNNQVFNTSEYGCSTCPENFIAKDNVCRPQNASFIKAYSNPIQYVSSCDNGTIQLGLVCFPNNTISSRINYLRQEFSANYYDVIKEVNSKTYDQISTQIPDDYLEQYAYAELFHSADPFNQTAVSLLSNACSVFNYDSNSYSCIQFNINFTQGIGSKYGYLFWPMTGPFISYGDHAPLRYISEEDYITKSYKLGDDITIQLARFSKYGEFKGFTKLTIDFQKCGESNDISENWQKYGYNYYSECFIDLKDLVISDSTDLFDPFIEDGTFEGKAILRPIPIILKNYRGSNGQDVNRGNEEKNYRAVRRFFFNDNYTSNEIAQYLTNFSIAFNLKPNNKHQILPPIFTIEYSQVRKSELKDNSFTLYLDKETISTPKYKFQINYLRSLSSFWQAAIIVFCLVIAIGLVYYFVFIIMFVRIFGIDGARSSVVLGIIGYLLDYLGTLMFIVAFSMSIYVFIFFKFQVDSFICLPEEKDFLVLIPFLLVALLLKLIGVILLIALKFSTSFFIIDWERPKEEDIPISGWRRIMVANEMIRVLTVRHYNVAFTVIAMAFIIGGFNLNLLASPIPSTKLVDMDKQYFILRFAFYSFVWLLLILFQIVMTRFVIWPIFGNPFYNLVDLCSTSNISILIRMCSYQAFYIHGKSPHLSADQNLTKLSANLKNEKRGTAQKRGLVKDSEEQVFEVFLTDELRHELNDMYNSQLAQTVSPSVFGLTLHAAADIPNAAYQVNEELNDFLKKFISKESDNHFVVQPKNCMQQLIDIPPIVIEDSVFMAVSDSHYSTSLLSGIEWKLQLLYLLIFVSLSIPVSSPCIPAIVVFIIDQIIIKIFNLFGRSDLAKKTLLDDRFFL